MTPAPIAVDPTPRTHYELLGVSYYASADDVRTGCERRLAVLDRMRPEGVETDAPPQAHERRDIMLAYMTLKDGQKRNAYNATLAAASAERAAAKARDADSGLTAPGWSTSAGQAATSQGKPQATANFGNTVTTVTTDQHATAAILREAPIDLREAARARDAERTRQRLARSGDFDDSHWAEVAPLGTRYVAMTLDSMIVTILIVAFVAARSVLFKNAAPWYQGGSTTVVVAGTLLTLAYYVWGECGGHKATLGKRMMGLQVVRADGVTHVGVLRAAARYGLRLVGSYVLMLGYLMAFVTARKQALHDKLTDTVVVSVRAPFAPALLVGLGASIAFAALLSTLAYRVAMSAATDVSSALAQAVGEQRFDPSRATPTRDEVRLAYFAAQRLQRASAAFRGERDQWADATQLDTLLARSEQPEALARYSPKILPFGMFALSLGATATGSAFLMFTPEEDDPQTAWRCVAIRVDAENLPSSCELMPQRAR